MFKMNVRVHTGWCILCGPSNPNAWRTTDCLLSVCWFIIWSAAWHTRTDSDSYRACKHCFSISTFTELLHVV